MFEIVSATRLAAPAFAESPLGTSLARVAKDRRLSPQIAHDNSRGLPDIYNARIDAASDDDILVFVHDDVWIEDFYFADRIAEGLRQFDVIGLAGNTRRFAGQKDWAHGPDGKLDLPHMRGAIAHGAAPLGKVGFFGPIVGECELLDGVLLAARAGTLRRASVRFDPRFRFHFYDLDFCRAARTAGLRLGTWPIAMTHRSSGNPYGDEWNGALELYREKWGD
jgi:GT2 family glycosyltransferase